MWERADNDFAPWYLMNIMFEDFDYSINDDVNDNSPAGPIGDSLRFLDNDSDNGQNGGNLELDNPNNMLHLMVMMPQMMINLAFGPTSPIGNFSQTRMCVSLPQ